MISKETQQRLREAGVWPPPPEATFAEPVRQRVADRLLEALPFAVFAILFAFCIGCAMWVGGP